MASCQQRGDKFQFRIVAKGKLPKPIFLTFDSKEEGEIYVGRLEATLKKGIVPPELLPKKEEYIYITDVIDEYIKVAPITKDDRDTLTALIARVGVSKLSTVNYSWAEGWVTEMKRVRHLAPETIRHYVGALARCFDWGHKKGIPDLISNPLRLFPKGYSSYNEHDEAALKKEGLDVKEDEWRDRRLEEGEEKAIRLVIAGVKPENRQRPTLVAHQAAIECLFDLALETAMRMREMYTLKLDQLNFEQRTIFLIRTKNGKKRQVPMSSVAIRVLHEYMDHVKQNRRGMEDFNFDEGRLFPWWDGTFIQERLRATSNRLSKCYAAIFDAAGCGDLRFHDLRHEATSRLFERTTMTEGKIMKITGHSSTEMLLRYANLRGSDLADQMW